MRKRKRQVVKKLIQCAAIIAAGVLAIILFMLAIWYRGKNSEPVTDEQVAAQMQQAEPLVIETPEAATEGSIRVYDYDGCCIYSYYGKIRINSDGKDGKDIDVEAIGYLEGYQEHKDDAKVFNPALKLAGVLITSYQNTDGEAAGVEWLEQKTDFNILGIIRYSKKVAENTFMRKPIYEYSPCCGAAQGYKKFVTAYTGKAR